MTRTALVLALFLSAVASASGQVHFCVARVDDKGMLHLREFGNSTPRTTEVDGVEIDKDGRPIRRKVTVTHQTLTETVMEFEASAATAFDGAGKNITAADLVKRLTKETPVVVLDGGKKLDASLTAALKKETLVLTVPFSFVALQAGSRGPLPIAPPPPPPIPPR